MHRAFSVFNLHPEVVIAEIDGDKVLLTNREVSLLLEKDGIGGMKTEPGFYAVMYGRRADNKRLVIPF